MSETLKAGDTVQLKSGGAIMTIDSITNTLAVCVWTDGNKKPHMETYNLTSLVKADPIDEPLLGTV